MHYPQLLVTQTVLRFFIRAPLLAALHLRFFVLRSLTQVYKSGSWNNDVQRGHNELRSHIKLRKLMSRRPSLVERSVVPCRDLRESSSGPKQTLTLMQPPTTAHRDQTSFRPMQRPRLWNENPCLNSEKRKIDHPRPLLNLDHHCHCDDGASSSDEEDQSVFGRLHSPCVSCSSWTPPIKRRKITRRKCGLRLPMPTFVSDRIVSFDGDNEEGREGGAAGTCRDKKRKGGRMRRVGFSQNPVDAVWTRPYTPSVEVQSLYYTKNDERQFRQDYLRWKRLGGVDYPRDDLYSYSCSSPDEEEVQEWQHSTGAKPAICTPDTSDEEIDCTTSNNASTSTETEESSSEETESDSSDSSDGE